MRFSELTVALARIRDASVIEKRTLVERLVASVGDPDLPLVVAVLAGEPLTDRRVALSRNQMMKILSSLSGRSVDEVGSELKRLGSLPLVAQSILGARKQEELVHRKTGVDDVMSAIQAMSQSGPTRAAAAKLTHLLSSSDPAVAGVILAILLGESTTSVPRSVLADALASRFGVRRTRVLSLVAARGWRGAALSLVEGLSASP